MSVPLNARAASTCARATHNAFDPTVPAVEWTPPETLQLRLDAGIAHEADVVEELLAVVPAADVVDLRDWDSDPGGQQAATMAALGAGVAVVVGGMLPVDVAGRLAKPDVLVRAEASAAGGPGYVPVDIKAYRVLRPTKTTSVVCSRWTAAAPSAAVVVEGRSVRLAQRQSGVLQLAHYWRSLESAGFAAARRPVGALAGTDVLDDGTVGPLVWIELDRAAFWTFSRSRGRVQRTALERYDHEFAFRQVVAAAALVHRGDPAEPPAMVEPVYQPECETCPWWSLCGPLLADHPSRAVGGSLDVREWQALAAAGITGVQDLAGLDEQEVRAGPEGKGDAAAALVDYWPEVAHHGSHAARRLADVVVRAQMLLAGETLRRRTCGPIRLRRGAVEVDLDIEWDAQDRVYLWGLLVGRPGEPASYEAIGDFSEQVDDAALAWQVYERLTGLRELARRAGGELVVFHYAFPEPAYLQRLLVPRGALVAGEVAALVEECFVDLYRVVRDHFVGVRGLGLKQVAAAAGFAWRDTDPGGAQSQVWLDELRAGGDPVLKRRLLAYNEDDVWATWWVRERLLDTGRDAAVPVGAEFG